MTKFLTIYIIICNYFFSVGQSNIQLQIAKRDSNCFLGNKIIQFIPIKRYKDYKKHHYLNDPVDDFSNYKHIVDNIYKDTADRIFIKTSYMHGWDDKDTTLFVEYYKDLTDFIDLKTYKAIKRNPYGYFINNGKVFIWDATCCGEYPIEIEGADPETFKPFKKVCGGTDENFVFYGSPKDVDGIRSIDGANPKTIKVLNPDRGCWNCNNCYFVDDKNVFFGFKRVDSADAKSFKLVNQADIDCADKNKKYFNGLPVQSNQVNINLDNRAEFRYSIKKEETYPGEFDFYINTSSTGLRVRKDNKEIKEAYLTISDNYGKIHFQGQLVERDFYLYTLKKGQYRLKIDYNGKEIKRIIEIF